MGDFNQNSSKEAQIAFTVLWFSRWDELKQADAVIKMFSSISPIQAKFLTFVLEDTVKEAINTKLEPQERDANNPDFIKRLMVNDEINIDMLLVHLPLLKSENDEAKTVYTTFLPEVFSNCIEKSTNIQAAKKLLKIVLIHPALKDARKEFELFELKLFKDEAEESATASGVVHQNFDSEQRKQKQLSSIEVALKRSCISERRNSISLERNSSAHLKKSRPTVPLNNNNYWQLPNGLQNQSTFNGLPCQSTPHPGMKDLFNWLKFQRLHKYYNRMVKLTYEQLLSLNEDNFDLILPGVTQGARRKFLLIIDDLRKRCSTLIVTIKEDIMTMSTASLVNVIDKLKTMIFTPLKAASESQRGKEGDIPYHFVIVLHEIFDRLVLTNFSEEQCVKGFSSLIYVTMRNEAFSEYHADLKSLKHRFYAKKPKSFLRLPSVPVPSPTPRLLERINHPQYNREETREFQSNSGLLSLAVGSGRRSQRSNSLNLPEVSSLDPDRAFMNNIRQRTRVQSWNGESVSEYRLFPEGDDVNDNLLDLNFSYCKSPESDPFGPV